MEDRLILSGNTKEDRMVPRMAPNALDGVYLMSGVEFFVAVLNKGVWPNLLLLPSGEILATFYNRPCHGFGYGDMELWVSTDRGETWDFRSQASDHSENPKSCRMNHAFGRTAEGELIVLVSGWGEKRCFPTPPVQQCISSDDGRTWRRRLLTELPALVPYGKIVLSPDGRLTCAMYQHQQEECGGICTSEDNGRNWGLVTSNVGGLDETVLLRCQSGKWLAAARIRDTQNNMGYLDLYSSTDDGRTWSNARQAPISGFPGDLLQLSDGKILLVAELREKGCQGLNGALSEDEGENWTHCWRFMSDSRKDICGGGADYFSSVQLNDGTIVTAYAWADRTRESRFEGGEDFPKGRGLPWHPYHMGVIRWRLETVLRQE